MTQQQCLYMSRIYIRRLKSNPDFWEVMEGDNHLHSVLSKTKAKEIAAATRRVKEKRKQKKKQMKNF